MATEDPKDIFNKPPVNTDSLQASEGIDPGSIWESADKSAGEFVDDDEDDDNNQDNSSNQRRQREDEEENGEEEGANEENTGEEGDEANGEPSAEETGADVGETEAEAGADAATTEAGTDAVATEAGADVAATEATADVAAAEVGADVAAAGVGAEAAGAGAATGAAVGGAAAVEVAAAPEEIATAPVWLPILIGIIVVVAIIIIFIVLGVLMAATTPSSPSQPSQDVIPGVLDVPYENQFTNSNTSCFAGTVWVGAESPPGGGYNGCGGTSEAMVARFITGNDAINLTYIYHLQGEHNAFQLGTLNNLIKSKGVQYTVYSGGGEEALNLIAGSIKKGYPGVSHTNPPYAHSTHVMVVVGFASNGDVYINDPNNCNENGPKISPGSPVGHDMLVPRNAFESAIFEVDYVK